MVQLVDGDIKTREVLDWKGVHILHFAGSSCSQKLRVFLNLKGIPWQSHPVDLPANENFRPWFLGINPRGLVPVLVHDGAVHIESNDIITYLEQAFPTPKLIPAGHESEVAALLKHEDDLHLDLRTLSFRFVFAPPGPPKSADGAGRAMRPTAPAPCTARRSATSRRRSSSGSAPPGTASPTRTRGPRRRNSAPSSTQLDRRLAQQPYLMGEKLSVLDIAWLIYAHRLWLAGYPFARLHPQVEAWRERLSARPEFAKEIEMVRHSRDQLEAIRRAQQQAGKTLEAVAGF